MATVPRKSSADLHRLARQAVEVVRADPGGLLTRGTAAGLFAGFGFILANMWFAASQGKPAIAPFLAISTVFHGSAMPNATPENVVIGLTLHFALSLVFGIGYATIVPLLRRPSWLVAGAAVYGLVLYVFNFQILGRTAFPWFTNPHGPNQLFELAIHPLIFGLLLAPFFLGWQHGHDRDEQPTLMSEPVRH